ncbi:protein tyrosine phosphatase type IVA 2 [Caerostris darwini]|uniref:Protein tyrosine phosphatase type IVA 2 n=1 Tax=Caerostris darwini TaxID=1538125 RepID=A0AAV4UFJ2_9ARAC|nr:protein tyrosine phosphatase type IVA 2 [Caerostris darwini]
MTMKQKVMRPGTSEIVYKNMRFLIMDRPTDATIAAFIEELKKKNVTEVVRVCEPTYKIDALEKHGIKVLDWQFDDGSPPPNKIVHDWFDLLRKRFKDDDDCYVAVHCVAGLGRAPVLVAIALMELGMKYEDAVEFIRLKRRGAINAKQLAYLQKYRPKSRLKTSNALKQCCIQ